MNEKVVGLKEIYELKKLAGRKTQEKRRELAKKLGICNYCFKERVKKGYVNCESCKKEKRKNES